MGDLLFNPNGRIGRSRFLQGMVVLTIATMLVSAGSRLIAWPFVFLHLGLVYPYICVVGKRLHDAGTSAWLALVVWIGAVVINQIVSGIAGVFLISPETLAVYETVEKHLERNEIEAAMDGLLIVWEATFSTAVISAVLTGIIVALALGALPSQQRENKHGPAPGNGPSEHF